MMYFVLGRASLWLMLHFKLLLAPLRAEWWRWSVLSAWTCVILLFFFSYRVLSVALISHNQSCHWSFPAWNETLFYEFQFLFLAYHHLPILTSYKVVLFYCCRRITAKFLLYGLLRSFVFTVAWVELVSSRKLNTGCKWEQIHSLAEDLVLIQKLK